MKMSLILLGLFIAQLSYFYQNAFFFTRGKFDSKQVLYLFHRNVNVLQNRDLRDSAV